VDRRLSKTPIESIPEKSEERVRLEGILEKLPKTSLKMTKPKTFETIDNLINSLTEIKKTKKPIQDDEYGFFF
jgi:hypothetical protein